MKQIFNYSDFLNEDYYKDENNRQYEPSGKIVHQNKDLEIGTSYFDEDGDEIIRYLDCDDLPLKISEESGLWETSSSNGQIVVSRDFSLLDKYPDNENNLEECPEEITNNFIIYDDGSLAWDSNWSDDDLKNEVILYIYFFFKLEIKHRTSFNEYWEDSFYEEEIEDFKKKYATEFLNKNLNNFGI